MSESRSNTIWAVVEQPDHHCGDDLVLEMPHVFTDKTTSYISSGIMACAHRDSSMPANRLIMTLLSKQIQETSSSCKLAPAFGSSISPMVPISKMAAQ